MSLWIYKCNNNPDTDGFYGDWDRMFEGATKSKSGAYSWGGPDVTTQPSGHKLALSAQPGQRFLCWQRWGIKPHYDLPRGVSAAAVGIAELVKDRPKANPGSRWLLRPIERFPQPVPLLEYRATNAIVDGVFRNPRQMGTFLELTPTEEAEVIQLCGLPRHAPTEWTSEAGTATKPPGGVGAGFGDSVENKKTEQAAVRFVTKLLRDDGWKVTSKESEKVGYDLLARRGAKKRHIEVKGIAGTKPSFIITAGEANAAVNDPKWEIWIITSAKAKKPKVKIVPGADLQQTHDLTVIAYRAEPAL